jgi:hypothetical protein
MTMVDFAEDFADAIGLRAAMAVSGLDDDVQAQADVPTQADVEVQAEPDVQAPIDQIKARLAARGLLQTQPAVVVPKEARRATPATAVDDDAPDAQQRRHWSEAPEDTWDVEPTSANSTTDTAVACPQCRHVERRPLESTRVACAPCDRAWRWATCGSCDALALTMERQESWRCAACGQFTRSWWRTPHARRDAAHVVARRKHEAMLQERAEVRAGMRKRRWKLVAFAAASATLAAALVIAVRAAEPSTATGTDAVCAHVSRLGADLATTPDLDHELETLQAEATGAAPDVAKAVDGLRTAGPPGTAAFLVARTALVDACTLAGQPRMP